MHAAAGAAPDRCTAACPPAAGAQSSYAWRTEWMRERRAFEAAGIGKEWDEALQFIRAQQADNFIWNVY